MSPSGLVETNSTFKSDQSKVRIDPREKTNLDLACVECCIFSIEHGSQIHMRAHDVHVDKHAFEICPWKKVVCVWVAVGHVKKLRRDH